METLRHGDECIVTFWYAKAKVHGSIVGIHTYPGKVKYDIELFGPENQATRIYNVDSQFVVIDEEWVASLDEKIAEK